MKSFAKITLSAALLTLGALSPLGIVALANDHDHHWDNDHGRGDMRGAPGPIAGAGLPVLAVGYGVYWLIRRRKSQ
jgi:hypothetical protein